MNKKIIKSVIDAITLNRLFNNNDQLKTNTVLQMKAACGRQGMRDRV